MRDIIKTIGIIGLGIALAFTGGNAAFGDLLTLRDPLGHAMMVANGTSVTFNTTDGTNAATVSIYGAIQPGEVPGVLTIAEQGDTGRPLLLVESATVGTILSVTGNVASIGPAGASLSLSPTGTVFDNPAGVRLGSGTTAQRGNPIPGTIRFNIETGYFEGFNGTNWVNFHH